MNQLSTITTTVNNNICARTQREQQLLTKNIRQDSVTKWLILNDSMLSSASAISAIGLEKTTTEEFQELKGFQAEVQDKVIKVTTHRTEAVRF